MINNKHLKDQQDIVDVFNDYFSSTVDNINKNNVNNKYNNAKVFLTQYYLEQNYAHPPPSLVIKTVSTKEITSIIKALKTKNSHGFDKISVKLFKVSATYTCCPLTHICNKSIASGIFPDHMKFSIVKPIDKKGNKMNPTNYRPISLLTSFLKVFEKALYIRVTEHLNTNNLLVRNQYGFRKNV
jgi:Notch-like protein